MRRFLAILIGVLCAAVAGGLLDGVVWPGTPLALFRPQFTLLLLVAALLAVLVGPRIIGLAGIGVVVLGVVLLVPAFRDPEPDPPPAAAQSVKVLALNLWRRNDDVAAVTELIREEKPDVLALTELTPTWARELAPALRSYPVRAVKLDDGTAGIGVYARRRLRDPKVVRLSGKSRPAVQGRLELAGRSMPFLVVHPTSALLPSRIDSHEDELAAIGEWARKRGPRSVVCGDFNATTWTRSLRDALEAGDLVAALPGGLFAGSWAAFLPPPLRIAVDGCLVGADVRVDVELGPRVGSDHLPVLIELA